MEYLKMIKMKDRIFAGVIAFIVTVVMAMLISNAKEKGKDVSGIMNTISVASNIVEELNTETNEVV